MIILRPIYILDWARVRTGAHDGQLSFKFQLELMTDGDRDTNSHLGPLTMHFLCIA